MPSIFIFRNVEEGVDFMISRNRTFKIGRNTLLNNWTPPNARAISNEHAVVEIRGESPQVRGFLATITDLGSRNGTFIGNGNPIEWNKVRQT